MCKVLFLLKGVLVVKDVVGAEAAGALDDGGLHLGVEHGLVALLVRDALVVPVRGVVVHRVLRVQTFNGNSVGGWNRSKMKNSILRRIK